MKYRINYGTSVGVFPKAALDVIKRAGEGELRVLLCLCAHEGNIDERKLSRLSGGSAETVREALSFWRGAGVIENEDDDAEADKTAEAEKPDPADHAQDAVRSETDGEQKDKRSDKKLQRSDELPNYTSDQLADILEKRTDTATLINECQNIMGKVFSVHEINILIGLVDYLTLDYEYIMILLTYCISIGKKTLHFAEKLAFSLYDAGICTPSELSEELRKRELTASNEGKIRSLFGIGSRAFTTNEKKYMQSWIANMGFDTDIIAKAYEITVDTTAKPSMKYTNAILERWYAEGLNTLEKIEESYKKDAKPGAQSSANSTFETDSFFDAAVRRAEAIMNASNGEEDGIQ